MDDERAYEKFIKYLSKRFFTLNEVRSFVLNDFVANVSQEEPDPKYKKFAKYSVKLVDGDVYYVYAKQ